MLHDYYLSRHAVVVSCVVALAGPPAGCEQARPGTAAVLDDVLGQRDAASRCCLPDCPLLVTFDCGPTAGQAAGQTPNHERPSGGSHKDEVHVYQLKQHCFVDSCCEWLQTSKLRTESSSRPGMDAALVGLISLSRHRNKASEPPCGGQRARYR